MKIVTIKKDNHGQIGIASNYQNAIHFLVNKHWLNELTEIYDSDFHDTKSLLDLAETQGCFFIGLLSYIKVLKSSGRLWAPWPEPTTHTLYANFLVPNLVFIWHAICPKIEAGRSTPVRRVPGSICTFFNAKY